MSQGAVAGGTSNLLINLRMREVELEFMEETEVGCLI